MSVLNELWKRPVYKPEIHGLHGTLFYDYAAKRRHLPKSRCEIDRNPLQINEAERDLYAGLRAKREG